MLTAERRSLPGQNGNAPICPTQAAKEPRLTGEVASPWALTDGDRRWTEWGGDSTCWPREQPEQRRGGRTVSGTAKPPPATQAPRKDAISFPGGSLSRGRLTWEYPHLLRTPGFTQIEPLDGGRPCASPGLGFLICKMHELGENDV